MKAQALNILIVAMVIAIGTIACSTQRGPSLGLPIPADAPVVSLSDIYAAPAQYNGTRVVVKGVITGQCASLCEFFFQEGARKATIFPQGYKFPKLPSGRPVTVYAEITSGNDNVVFSALGLTVQ